MAFSPAFATGGVQHGLHHLLAGRVHRLPHGGPRPSPSSATADVGSSTIGSGDVLLILPAAGAVSSELLPNRNKIDGRLAAVMATTGVINATGEELL